MEEIIMANLSEVLGVNKDVNNLQYLEYTTTERIVNVYKEKLNVDLNIDNTEDDKGNNVKVISKYDTTLAIVKNNKIELFDLLKIIDNMNRLLLENHYFGNLKELRKQYLNSVIIYGILEDYELITKKDKELLENNLIDVDEVIKLVKEDRIEIPLNGYNPVFINTLKSTLEELGYVTKITDSTFYNSKKVLKIS